MGNEKADGKSSWNVMVYLAGNNSLSEECVWALTEIQGAMKGNEGRGVVVSAQFDSPVSDTKKPRYLFGVPKRERTGTNGEDVERGPQQREQRSEPKRKGLGVNEDKRTDVEEKGPQRILRDFIFDRIVEYPAKRYLLVLSGHGSGTIGDFLRSGRHALSIPELREVFDGGGNLEGLKKQLEDKEKELKKNEPKETFLSREGKEERKIDILGMDSCLMSMVEVAYELRNHVRYMVGAEGFEANTGWPFREILTQLIKDQSQSLDKLVPTFVSEYIDYYKTYVIAGRSVDMAACDLSRCGDLAAAIGGEEGKGGLVRVLSERLEEIKVKNAVLLAHWEAQSYKDDQYVDLYDFCQVLQRKLEELDVEKKAKSEIGDACEVVKKAVKAMAVESCYSGPSVQHSYGLSIYFPWSQPRVLGDRSSALDSYSELQFAKKTGWHTFLHRYLEITRRELRIPKWMEGMAGKDRPKHLLDASGQNVIERMPEKDRPQFDLTSGQLVPDTSSPSHSRDTDPHDKDTDPHDKMLSNRIGSMKNPPIFYYPGSPESKPESKNDASQAQTK